MSNSCGLCRVIDQLGHFPDGVIHCGEGSCHRTWSALGECHCSGCHQHFGSERAFDDHRRGGVCKDPARLPHRLKPVLRRDGITWVQNDGREDEESDASQIPTRSAGARRRAANRARRAVSDRGALQCA